MSSAQTTVEAVRKSLVVKCSPERAFQVFTAEIGSWWPLQRYSIGEEKITEVVFEQKVGGRVFERHTDGGEGEWGRVLEWDPPHRLVMSWYPGSTAAEATELEIRFAAHDDGARVELEHRGWEILGDAALETRTSYDGGWAGVLADYEGAANAANS